MALTIVIEGTGVIANCDAISDTAGGTWFELGGGTIDLSNDVYLVGGASIGGKYASKSGVHAIDKGATTYNFTSGGNQEGELLYIWIAMTAIGKVRHENGFARQHTFSGTEQFSHQALVHFRTVAHFGFKRNTVVHVIHRAGLRDHSLARIKLDFDNLHIIPMYLEVDFVARHTSLL